MRFRAKPIEADSQHLQYLSTGLRIAHLGTLNSH
jgi:hypothetical protein